MCQFCVNAAFAVSLPILSVPMQYYSSNLPVLQSGTYQCAVPLIELLRFVYVNSNCLLYEKWEHTSNIIVTCVECLRIFSLSKMEKNIFIIEVGKHYAFHGSSVPSEIKIANSDYYLSHAYLHVYLMNFRFQS